MLCDGLPEAPPGPSEPADTTCSVESYCAAVGSDAATAAAGSATAATASIAVAITVSCSGFLPRFR